MKTARPAHLPPAAGAAAIALLAAALGLIVNQLRPSPLAVLASPRALAEQVLAAVREDSPKKAIGARRKAEIAPVRPGAPPKTEGARAKGEPAPVRKTPAPAPVSPPVVPPKPAPPRKQPATAKALFADLSGAKKLYDAGALFLDARLEQDFRTGHIKGAISLPSQEVETRFAQLEDRLRKASVIVTYCEELPCDSSTRLADQLTRRGLARVYIFFGGYPAWQKAGYPVAREEP
jgi:rhodanese-related sulfurtransferase